MSARSRTSLRARMRLSSLPVTPTARPPSAFTSETISLLTRPPSTICTTSIVAASVTRMPSTKWLSMARRSSRAPICGPPPCTMTGRMPTNFINTTSRAKECFSASSSMAAPPYLMTTVAPWNALMYGSASTRTLVMVSRFTAGVRVVAPPRQAGRGSGLECDPGRRVCRPRNAGSTWGWCWRPVRGRSRPRNPRAPHRWS